MSQSTPPDYDGEPVLPWKTLAELLKIERAWLQKVVGDQPALQTALDHIVEARDCLRERPNAKKLREAALKAGQALTVEELKQGDNYIHFARVVQAINAINALARWAEAQQNAPTSDAKPPVTKPATPKPASAAPSTRGDEAAALALDLHSASGLNLDGPDSHTDIATLKPVQSSRADHETSEELNLADDGIETAAKS